MCSENGRLRAEIERLRAEEREVAEAGSLETSLPQDSNTPEAFESELLAKVVTAVHEALAHGPAGVGTEREPQDAKAETSPGEAQEDAAPLQEVASAIPAEEVPRIEARVAAAVRAALQEEAESSTPAPALTPAEETAVLVGERVALRELVERQNERIRALQAELREANAAQPGVVLSNALSVYAQGVTDVQEAFSAGMKTVLATPKEKRGAAIIGAEYEVIGRRGTIVRNGESLRAEIVADLPPGSRVRVVGLSEKYSRRVEIICIRTAGASASSTQKQAIAEGADDAARDPGIVDGSASTEGQASLQVVDDQTPEEEEDVQRINSLVTGWISACDKDGRMLIRLAPKPAEEGSGSDADREEGNEEIVDVTLSQDEWQALHQDSEVSKQKVETLTGRLNKMGVQLLQSFEMRSVLGELNHSVDRAEDRRSRMREVASMASEELEQRRMNFYDSKCAVEEARLKAEVAAANPSCATPASSSSAVLQNGQGKETSPGGKCIGSFDKVDWDRLMTERETTAAALSAGLQRLAVLEKEVKELDAERELLDLRGKEDIGGLRTSLRRRAQPVLAAMSKVFKSTSGASCSNVASECPSLDDAAAAEGLFKRRLEDLQALP
jgi:hypothetical protein